MLIWLRFFRNGFIVDFQKYLEKRISKLSQIYKFAFSLLFSLLL